MSRVSATFTKLRAEGRVALMPFLTLGYPSPEKTLELLPAMVEAGADMFELGVPFSDPVAEGKTVQHSSHVALQHGMTPRRCLELTGQIRARVNTPLLLMGYYNPIHRYGLDAFCRDAASSGADGLIVADLPPDEGQPLRDAARAHGLDLIFLVAPTSTDDRLRRVAEVGSGFVYCVSVTGVTGARQQLSDALADLVNRVRQRTDLPIAVGFGISRPEHAAAVANLADGVIVGSALIDRIESLPPEEQVRGAAAYIAELRRAAVKSGGPTGETVDNRGEP